MKFSIITVCYNSAGSIRDTFESVLQQDCDDYEYLVVDGASRDDTLAIIREYEPRFAGRMRWISEPDGGIYEAMNKGLAMARGEWIGILNSDDRYEQQTLSTVNRQIGQQPNCDICYGQVRFVNATGVIQGTLRHPHQNLPRQTLCHPGCFVQRRTYDRIGNFDCSYRISADYDFLLRCFLQQAVFLPVDAVLAEFTTGGACYQGEAQAVKENLQIRRRYELINPVEQYWELGQFHLTKWVQRLLRRPHA